MVDEADRRVIRLAGQLSEAQVPDLLRACAGGAGAVHLDLTELLSADAVGIEALHRMRSNGAALVGVPEYIHLKLESRSRALGFRPRIVPPPRKPKA